MKLVWQSSKPYPVGIRLVLLIYVVAFSIGTATHLIINPACNY